MVIFSFKWIFSWMVIAMRLHFLEYIHATNSALQPMFHCPLSFLSLELLYIYIFVNENAKSTVHKAMWTYGDHNDDDDDVQTMKWQNYTHKPMDIRSIHIRWRPTMTDIDISCFIIIIIYLINIWHSINPQCNSFFKATRAMNFCLYMTESFSLNWMLK